MICQLLLSGELLRELGIRVVIVYPAHTKGAEREIVDCGQFPVGGCESIGFSMLLYGCDYATSALGFGFDPTRVLFSSSFYAAFTITPERLAVRGPSLAGLIAQLKDDKKQPRKLFLCSAGRRHISRPAAVAASASAFQRIAGPSAGAAAPRAVERTTADLYASVTDILTVLWYWRFAGSSAALRPAGPPPLLRERGPADLFGVQPLAAVLEGTVPPTMEPEVVLGDARADADGDHEAADTDSSGEAPEADRDGTPSPAKRRRSLDSSTFAQ
jgi:hypothetical protein